MCTSQSSMRVLSSAPGITRIPSFLPSIEASSTQATVSWSVIAIALSPFFFAYLTSSVGVYEPSDAVVCACRSTIFIVFHHPFHLLVYPVSRRFASTSHFTYI